MNPITNPSPEQTPLADLLPETLEENSSQPSSAYVVNNPASLPGTDGYLSGAVINEPQIIPASPSPKKTFAFGRGVLVATIIMVALISGVMLLIANNRRQEATRSPSLQAVPVQSVDLASPSAETTAATLQGTADTLVVNGNVYAKGTISLYNEDNAGTFEASAVTADQTYTLPNASGTLCLSSNNCQFATAAQYNLLTAQLAAVQGQAPVTLQGGTGTAIVGNSIVNTGVLSLNGITGNITLQGTANRVIVGVSGNTITLSAPQDIGQLSTPTFQSITLTTVGTQNGNTICDSSNNCGLGGGNINNGGNSFGAPITIGTNDNFGLNLEVNTAAVVSISNTGAAVFRPSADGTASFQIQNSSSTPLLVADTTNSRLYVGNPTADATGALLVLDTKNTAGDPTGVNGGLYYNSNTNKFRCYENGAWADCIGAGGDGGVTTVGTIDSQAKSADGAVISGVNLYLQTADATNPGLVSTGTQTFAGAKTFSGAITLQSNLTQSGGTFSLTGNAASSLQTTVGALTLTSAAAATWSTAAGNLTIQGGSGTVSLGTSTNLTSGGALTISSGGAGALILDSASNVLQLAASDTTIQRTAAGTTTLDLVDGADTTFAITNSGAGVANITADGSLTAVGVNSTTGLLQGSGGLTVTGAVNINTTGTANTAIGNATGTIAITSNAFNVTSGGAISGITGYAQTSGNFAQSGAGTFGTGTGAVSLNGNTTVTGSSTFTVNSGASVFGGNVTINGSQFTNNGSTLNTAQALGDFPAGGAIGTAAATVDVDTAFTINQTTAGQTLSLPSPTSTTAGRLAYVSNIGSASFIMHGVTISAGSSQLYIWNGTAWTPSNVDGAGSGVTTVGALDGQAKNANGATISGNSIYLQTADATNPGLVSTGTQTFAGAKTFSGNLTGNGNATFAAATNSATAFQIQNATAADTLFTADTAARGVSGGNRIKIGNSTGTDGDLTILQVDAATANPTSNLSALNGGLFYNSTTNKLSVIENGAVKVLCNTTDLACGSAGSGVTTIGTIDSQTKSADGAVISGVNLYMQTADATNPGLVSTGTQTFAGAKTFSGAVTLQSDLTQSGGAFSLTGNAASSLQTTVGALTLTSAAAATWSTAAGNLTIQGGSGTVSLGTSTSLTAGGALTISSGGAGALTLDSASNVLQLAATDTTIQRTAVGTTTLDLVDSSNTTFAVTNSGAGVANITADGSLTAVGVNSTTGLLQGSGGLTVTGAVNINTTGTANTAIGNGTGTIAITSNAFNVNTAGAISGVTGYAQTSGNFAQSGVGTFDTGTGAVSLNGNTTITGSATLSVNSGLSTFGGNVTINGSQFTNNGSTLNTAQALGDFPAGGAIGTAAATVDVDTSFTISQTTAGQTLSLPSPTSTTAGRVVYISNTGSASFLMHGVTIGSGFSHSFVWNGTAWTSTGDGLGGNTITLQQAYDNDADGSDSIIALTAADDSLIFRNPSSGGTDGTGYVVTIDQLATGAVGGLDIQSAGTGNLLRVRDTTATARDVLTIADGGATIFRNQTDSTAAFRIQNAAGSGLFNFDTTAGALTLGSFSGGVTGSVIFRNAVGSGFITLTPANPGASTFTLTMPAENGTLCSTGSVCSGYAPASGGTGYVQLQGSTPGSPQTGHFNISGTGIAGTLQATNFDTASGVVLNLGNTNATGTSICNSATCDTITIADNADADSITIGDSSDTVTIEGSSAATGIQIGNGTTAHGIQIGSNATGDNDIILGGLNAGSTTLIQGGTGASAIAINSGSGGTISVGSSGVANTLQLGNTTGAVTQTINIGNNATASSTSNINIGSSVAGTTAITGPTTITNRTSGSADTFNVSNSTSTGTIAEFKDDTTNVFSLADGGAALFQNTSNSATAFQIQDAAGTTNLLVADTTNGRISIGDQGTDTAQLYVGGRTPAAALDTITTGDDTGPGRGPDGVVAQGNYVYLINYDDDNLEVYDATNPADLTFIGRVEVGSSPEALAVQGRYAYVVNSSVDTMSIVDVGNPAAPVVTDTVSTGDLPINLVVQGRYAYVLNQTGDSIQVFDVANPVDVSLVSTFNTNVDGPRDAYLQGKYLYVINATTLTLQIIDVSNPASLSSVDTEAIATAPLALAVTGRYAYVTDQTNLMYVLDVSNPSAIVEGSNVFADADIEDLVVQGRYLYGVSNQGATSKLYTYDISNPATPLDIANLTTGSQPFHLAVQGRYAYVTTYSSDTLATYDIGGAYIQQLEAGGIKTTTLDAQDVNIRNNANIGGALTVSGSTQLNNNLGVAGQVLFRNSADSTAAFQVQNASGTISLINADTTNSDVTINGRAVVNASSAPSTEWTRTSQTTPGTIALSGTADINDITASVVHNGSLYVGTNEGAVAEVYRYDGGTTWTRVSFGAGTIDSGGTASIEAVKSMVSFGGSLYIGTDKGNAGEIYRYESGTDWTKISNATAGTIDSGGTAAINEITKLVSFDGSLYVSTFESGAAEVYRYVSGTDWTRITAAAGQVDTGELTALDGIRLVVHEGFLYAGTEEAASAEIYRYESGTDWTKISTATAGTIDSGGTTAIDSVDSLVSYNGSLYAGTQDPNSGEIYRYESGTDWTRITQAAGTIALNGTTQIDSAKTLTVYNGSLYVTTEHLDGDAEVYRYDSGNVFEVKNTITNSALVIGGDGSALFKNSTNSTTAFQIQNSSGSQLLTADTTNMQIIVGGDILASAAPTIGDVTRATTTITDAGAAGQYSSVAIPSDGLPIISYQDATNGDLAVVKCGNAACSSGNTVTKVSDGAGDTWGLWTSLAIGSDGFAVISHYNSSAADLDLVVTKCTNASCSTNSSTKITDTDDIGQYSHIEVPVDGLPVIYMKNITDNDVAVLKCGNASCSSGNTLTKIVTANSDGSFGSMTISDSDGFPVISHRYATGGDLSVTKCTNASCSTNSTTTIADANSVGFDTSITMASDGLPIISHHDNTNADLAVTKCANSDCTSVTSTVKITGGNLEGYWTDIAIGTDGLPIISYWDDTLDDIGITKCLDNVCTVGTNVTTKIGDVTTGEIGTSIAIDPSTGFPIISEYNAGATDLAVLKCATLDCASATGINATGGSNIGSLTQYFKNIYAVNYFGKNYSVLAFDVAEEYEVEDQSIGAAEIVSLNTSTGKLKRASANDRQNLFGIVSTQPGLSLRDYEANRSDTRMIALVGRVPLKVKGPITAGDPITISETDGVGVKATSPGMIVGRALASTVGDGTVEVYVQTSYYQPVVELQGSTFSQFQNLLVSGELQTDSLTVNTTANFKGDIVILGHIIGNEDSRGVIVIPANESTTTKAFLRVYQTAPHVLVTPKQDMEGIRYWVSEDIEGFTIHIAPTSANELQFNYMVQQ